MTASTLIVDYVGRGSHAARPATPNIPTGATAVYYETDTTIVFVWDGSAWHALNAATPGSVTSVALSVPASSLFGVSGSPVTTTGTLGVTTTGTSGGIPYFFDANTLKTSGALTANLPVIGGGAGAAPTVGTRSGNTTSFATTSGSLTNTHLAVFDASGNIVDGGAPSGGAGAMVLISTLTASSSASLAWTGLSTFTTYRLVGRILIPTTDTADLSMQFGSGGGPTYATANYHTADWVSGQSGNSGRNDSAASAARLAFNVHNVTPGVGALDVLITTDGAYVAYTGTVQYLISATSWETATIAGYLNLAAALTAIKILPSGGGTIASGTASLYSVSS